MALPAAGLDALWPQEGAAESPGRTGSAGRGVDVEENHIFFFCVCFFVVSLVFKDDQLFFG
jgi:hypothetical protein